MKHRRRFHPRRVWEDSGLSLEQSVLRFPARGVDRRPESDQSFDVQIDAEIEREAQEESTDLAMEVVRFEGRFFVQLKE